MASRPIYLPNLKKINKRSASTIEETSKGRTDRIRQIHSRQFSMSTIDTELKLKPIKTERQFKSTSVKLSVIRKPGPTLQSACKPLCSEAQREYERRTAHVGC